ncbi:spore coat protein [Natranaerobius thermophilus]|uniref:Coat F domain protein n=1 Tax=Natranaerobius thermophilus (strain ATCC BAA-1301 / DSM 18059 / JW/NM-WN-LF) TaxID=457570 RepID=B2A6K1_NATTJ|nr:spore coat protein [Natranaerobius thermophilus]ACB85534.1 Coat F domain protein [Natranaerobius thermophilus JW/NM-WN-LF]
MQPQNQRNISDKDMLNDLLSTTKHVSSVYHQGVLEANSQDTRQAFFDLHDHTLEQHLNMLETMKSKGWYQPEMATGQNQSSQFQGQGQQQQYFTRRS